MAQCSLCKCSGTLREIDIPGPSFGICTTCSTAHIENARLKSQLDLALPELKRLQDLCQMQEQHGTEHAIKVSEENTRLKEEVRILREENVRNVGMGVAWDKTHKENIELREALEEIVNSLVPYAPHSDEGIAIERAKAALRGVVGDTSTTLS